MNIAAKDILTIMAFAVASALLLSACMGEESADETLVEMETQHHEVSRTVEPDWRAPSPATLTAQAKEWAADSRDPYAEMTSDALSYQHYAEMTSDALSYQRCYRTLYIIVDTRANVRSTPSLKTENIVGKAYNGDLFCASRQSSDGQWWYGKVRELEGWVSGSLLSLSPPRGASVPTASHTAKCYATPPPGCVIKGNVAFDTGEKIYHLPGNEYYPETKINPEYGECWFCSEADARALGWRRAYK